MLQALPEVLFKDIDLGSDEQQVYEDKPKAIFRLNSIQKLASQKLARYTDTYYRGLYSLFLTEFSKEFKIINDFLFAEVQPKPAEEEGDITLDLRGLEDEEATEAEEEEAEDEEEENDEIHRTKRTSIFKWLKRIKRIYKVVKRIWKAVKRVKRFAKKLVRKLVRGIKKVGHKGKRWVKRVWRSGKAWAKRVIRKAKRFYRRHIRGLLRRCKRAIRRGVRFIKAMAKRAWRKIMRPLLRRLKRQIIRFGRRIIRKVIRKLGRMLIKRAVMMVGNAIAGALTASVIGTALGVALFAAMAYWEISDMMEGDPPDIDDPPPSATSQFDREPGDEEEEEEPPPPAKQKPPAQDNKWKFTDITEITDEVVKQKITELHDPVSSQLEGSDNINYQIIGKLYLVYKTMDKWLVNQQKFVNSIITAAGDGTNKFVDKLVPVLDKLADPEGWRAKLPKKEASKVKKPVFLSAGYIMEIDKYVKDWKKTNGEYAPFHFGLFKLEHGVKVREKLPRKGDGSDKLTPYWRKLRAVAQIAKNSKSESYKKAWAKTYREKQAERIPIAMKRIPNYQERPKVKVMDIAKPWVKDQENEKCKLMRKKNIKLFVLLNLFNWIQESAPNTI